MEQRSPFVITVEDGRNSNAIHIINDDVTNNLVALNIESSVDANVVNIIVNGNVGNSETSDGAIFIENTGNNGFGLNVYSNRGASNAPLVNIRTDDGGFDQYVLNIRNDGISSALHVIQAGDLANNQVGIRFEVVTALDNAGNRGFQIYTNAPTAASTTPFVEVVQDNASAANTAVKIINDGTGAGLWLENNGTPASSALKIDGSAGTTTEDPTTDAPLGWLQVNIDNTDVVIPFYSIV